MSVNLNHGAAGKIFLSISLLIALYGFVLAGEPERLTILYTNDMHGNYIPSKATWLDREPDIGGFEALSYYVKTERDRAVNSLLLDAGDLMTGSMICDIEYRGAYGGALIAMMNMMGYDGMTPGNHEFDISVANFRALENLAEFPMLCANMVKGDEPLTERAYHIYRVGGLNVGVIGLTYHPMQGMVSDPNLEGFDSIAPENVLDSLVTEIDPLTDVIVILSHSGLARDREIAQTTRGLDLIVGGHDHSELHEPELVNGVLIVRAGSNCQFLGRIDLTVDSDSVVHYDAELIPMLVVDLQPDPRVSAMVSQFSSEIDKLYGKVLGKLKERWENAYGEETVAGNWITDILRKRLYTDLAIVNSGAIRQDLGPGDITVRDILEMLPFDNQIITFGCTGRQLRSIAEQNIGFQAEGYIYPLQISGMTCLWRKTDSGNEIVELLVNGEPVDSDRIYYVASLDYVVIYNSERYFGFRVRAFIKTNYKLTDLVIEDIQKNGIFESKTKNRFREIEYYRQK
ncbi:MAG: bifunctional metallophosphatase/5'-nucleotidase [Candidatus Zixiibacteriota bacterium]|nr:MAG: bifunctional metallophosphatase/5'-nucleotidase [candidate division Zixibacteria bacterium]